MDALGQ